MRAVALREEKMKILWLEKHRDVDRVVAIVLPRAVTPRPRKQPPN